MKKMISVGLIVLFTTTGFLLMAIPYHHQGTGVSIWFPDKWKTIRVGRALYAESPDGLAIAQYTGLGVRDMSRARATYRRFLEPRIHRVRVIREGRKFEHHNLIFTTIIAEGWIKGIPWDLKIYLIQTPRNIGMLVQRHQRGSMRRKIPFTNILESIKPL